MEHARNWWLEPQAEAPRQTSLIAAPHCAQARRIAHMKAKRQARVKSARAEQPAPATVPLEMQRLAAFMIHWMGEHGQTIHTVSEESDPLNPANRIHPTTVWRFQAGKLGDIKAETLLRLARGLGVDEFTLKRVMNGGAEAKTDVRAVELDAAIWRAIERDARAQGRTWQEQIKHFFNLYYDRVKDRDAHKLRTMRRS
jgi:hypothetical protein